MRKILTGIFVIICAFSFTGLYAQEIKTAAKKTFQVGIFAPVYLDSVFKGNNYRYSENFPRFILQGLDFIQGAQIALDSMPFPNSHI